MRKFFVLVALCLSVVFAKCGIGKGGCSNGQCCSYWGYCGSSSAFCGSGSKQCVCDCNGKNPCVSSTPSTTPSSPSTSSCTKMTVATDSLNQRVGPGTNYNINGTLKRGEEVCVVSSSNGWSLLNTGKYVSSSYLKAITVTPDTSTCKTFYVNADSLYQRTGPGTSYKKSGTLSYGAKVCVVSTANGWARLNDGSYVSDQYLTSNPISNVPTIQITNTKVLDALLNSQWKSKAYTLTVAFDVATNAKYPTACAIGLMANLIAEGNYGIVETAFAKYHNFGFYLPSGSTSKARTIADIKYVRDWTTKNTEFKKMTRYTLKNGSCGFGSVQWSYDRRVNFAKVCLEIMKTDADVNNANYAVAEAKFIAQELKNKYYDIVSPQAIKAGGSVEAWAEAFTDFYEKPAGSDGNMSGTGSACKTRRANARSLYNYLKGKGVI